MLEVKSVDMIFGGLAALKDVSLAVPQHQIHGLIGPNGSGKTTLINVITGFYAPTSGEVIFDGKKISGLAPNVISLNGLGRTFQNVNRDDGAGECHDGILCQDEAQYCIRHFPHQTVQEGGEGGV